MKALRFSVAAAAALALALPASVSAAENSVVANSGTQIKFFGDARLRGTINSMGDSFVDDETAKFDTRLRFGMHAKTESGVEAYYRLRIFNTDVSGENFDDRADKGGSGLGIHPEEGAWVKAPLMENATLQFGMVVDDWGTSFSPGYGYNVPLADMSYTLSDDMTIGLEIVKNEERKGAFGVMGGENDHTTITPWIAGKSGDLNYGVRFSLENDNNATTGGSDTSDTHIAAFVTGKVNGIDLAAELHTMSGDSYDDDPMGIFVQGLMPLDDQLTVGAALAVTMNGYESSKYFAPTALIGTVNPTGIVDFGGDFKDWKDDDGDKMPSTTGDGTDMAIVIPVIYKMSDTMSIDAKLAHLTVLDGDESLTELDLGVSARLSQDVSYRAVMAYGMPSMSGEDDILTLHHAISVRF